MRLKRLISAQGKCFGVKRALTAGHLARRKRGTPQTERAITRVPTSKPNAAKQLTSNEGKATTLMLTEPTDSAAKFEKTIEIAKSEPRGAVAGNVTCRWPESDTLGSCEGS